MGDRLSPGDTAPDFTLPDDAGSEVTLGALRGGKVIVYFYPAAMTPGCTTQACDFSDSLESLKADGYTVLGISPDAPAKLARFREKEELTIRLLSDADRSVMQRWGAFGEKSSTARPSRASSAAPSSSTRTAPSPRLLQRQGHWPRREAPPRPRTRVRKP